MYTTQLKRLTNPPKHNTVQTTKLILVILMKEAEALIAQEKLEKDRIAREVQLDKDRMQAERDKFEQACHFYCPTKN